MSDESYLNDLREYESILAARLAVLEQVDWVGKAEGWRVPSVDLRRGRYLVLWFSVDGSRVSKYIGSDRAAVAAALAGVEAQREYETVKLELFQLREMIRDVENEFFFLRKKCQSYLLNLQMSY